MARRGLIIFASYYPPAYKAGGPAKSISMLAEALAEKLRVVVLTNDRDLGDKKPFSEICANSPTQLNGVTVLYLSSALAEFSAMWSLSKRADFDSVYLNELFSWRAGILPLLVFRILSRRAHTIIFAPRGSLGEGALRQKYLKKMIALAVLKGLGLYRNITWHVTSELEKRDVQRRLPSAKRIFVAPNPAPYKPLLAKIGRTPYKNLVYVSRICEKKNLLGLVRAMHSIKQRCSFDIYGPIEDRHYWARCESALTKLPSTVKWAYRGPLRSSEVRGVLNQYDLMLLPTFNENFGNIILEALSSACPVLTSVDTPWTDIELSGAGLIVDPSDPGDISRGLSLFLGMPSVKQQEMKQNAVRFFEQWRVNHQPLDQFLTALDQSASLGI